MSYDKIFKAYSDWIGAYFRGDRTEHTLRGIYFDMVNKLPEGEAKHWPI
jgi:hypothetical protein